MAFDKRLLAAANQAAGTVHSRTKNSFLQAGDLGECGAASEVANAKSLARVGFVLAILGLGSELRAAITATSVYWILGGLSSLLRLRT